MSRPLVVVVDPSSPDAAALSRPAALLRDGGLVAFPTETVYGLGANALDADAVGRVFTAKGRPGDNPLIVHLARAEQLAEVVVSVTPLAADLAARYWPGPLTLVLDAAAGVPDAVTAGLGTVAVRVPDHPVARALIGAAGVPVAAPSANRSGRPSPTTARHVLDDLGAVVDAVVDGGPCRIGLESTVVDARGGVPVVLRDGSVSREQLGAAPAAAGEAELAASPGTRHAHYRPACRVELAPVGRAAARATELAERGERVGLLAAMGTPAVASAGVTVLGGFRDAGELAAGLYGWLREAERLVDVLVVEQVPERGVGRAVMDRLRRSAGA